MLAKAKNCPLATDDGPTIKACKIINIEFITAIHFLIRAYKDNILGEDIAFAKLEKLKKYGRYSSRIIDDTYKKIKEA